MCSNGTGKAMKSNTAFHNFQIPRSNNQAVFPPEDGSVQRFVADNNQISITKGKKAALFLGHWDLFGSCFLVFGIFFVLC
jgi:hypothetical protein